MAKSMIVQSVSVGPIMTNAYIVGCPETHEGAVIDPEALKAFLKSRISSFKVPKEFRVVSELPKSPAGKILKRKIRNDVKQDIG